jgi:HAMP domain-containing protein
VENCGHVVPHAVIMRQTMGVMGPVSLALLGMSLLFFLAVSALSRNISRPLADVAKASKAIASGGGLERPIRSEREDEIGQLSLAFSQMQRSLKQRLDELALLLGVSNQLAATVDLNEGMKAVLQGVLRGTGAAGVRAVVRNPVAPAPLLFAEGPSADEFGCVGSRRCDTITGGFRTDSLPRLRKSSPNWEWKRLRFPLSTLSC